MKGYILSIIYKNELIKIEIEPSEIPWLKILVGVYRYIHLNEAAEERYTLRRFFQNYKLSNRVDS